MKFKHQYKLLSKTTIFYLVFTLIAFFSSALVLSRQINRYIESGLEYRFHKMEGKIHHYIKHNKPLERLKDSATIQPLAAMPDTALYPVYGDTLVFDEGSGQMEQHGLKTTWIKVDDKVYEATIFLSIAHLVQLRNEIFSAIIPAFVLLALCIILFNLFMSGYLFRPFNAILKQMRNYKVGRDTKVPKINTNTLEFRKMQDLFHQMTDRIEHDYRHLKEYTENMAHEIQTPLSVILNKTENLISNDAVMQNHAESVKIIYDEANHLSKLGNTLNLLTKIENGEYNQADTIKTKPVVEKHIAAVSELAQLKKMRIETDLNPRHEFLITPLLLDIIIKNLLRNALSYGTTDGPIRITSRENFLQISNYGPPLAIDENRIFERFANHNNGRKASLGLGLALVKKICNLNDLQVDYAYVDLQHTFTIRKTKVSEKVASLT